MSRHARAILATLCASVAAPATPTAIASPPESTGSFEPWTSIKLASASRLKRAKSKKLWPAVSAARAAPAFLDIFSLVHRGLAKLGGEHDILTKGTRITLKEELARGAYGTVVGGEYQTLDGHIHTIAVKHMLIANPKQVLTVAMGECAATLNGKRGGLERGVVPCYGVVVGRNITEEWLASNMPSLSQAEADVAVGRDGRVAEMVPLVVGRWSGNSCHSWNVALLVPWVKGAVTGHTFAHDRFFKPTASEAAAATPVRTLHSALSAKNNWRHVPAAIVACVTRAAKFLADHQTWHRNIKPSNMLFTPDFATRPFAPENCLFIGFGSAVDWRYTAEIDTTSRGYLHPEARRYYPMASPSLHHVLDLFTLTTSATHLLLSGVGHPLLRCMRKDARRRAASLLASPSGLDEGKRHDIAVRLAALSENDVRGMAVASALMCDKMGKLVTANGGIDEDEARETRSAFMDRAKLFGWATGGEELGPTPELAAVARLFRLTAGSHFRLTAGKTQTNTAGAFMTAYNEILEQHVKSEGANGFAVKE